MSVGDPASHAQVPYSRAGPHVIAPGMPPQEQNAELPGTHPAPASAASTLPPASTPHAHAP